MRPAVDRALAASLHEEARTAYFSLPEDDSIELRGSVKGRHIGREALDACAGPEWSPERLLFNEACLSSGAAPGERTISFVRRTESKDTTLASFEWTPTCSEETCDEIHVYWAPDGSAVAVVAGAVVAQREMGPECGPAMQPAEVIAVDLKTKATSRDRLTLRGKRRCTPEESSEETDLE